MPVRGLPSDLESTFVALEHLGVERGVQPGDKARPIPVPAEHRDPAKYLWELGLLTLNASPDDNGEYFSRAVLTPLARPACALVVPVCPVGDFASKIEVIREAGNALLLTSTAGADLAEIPSRGARRHRFEVRHWNRFSFDHQLFAVCARLDLAAVEVININRWATELEGVVIDAALNPSPGVHAPCVCDWEESEHVVVENTEPVQDDTDIELIGARVRLTLRGLVGNL